MFLKVFEKIDGIIIGIFQNIVQSIELTTSLTRYVICVCMFWVFRLIGIFFLIFVALAIYTQPMYLVLLGWVYGMSQLYKDTRSTFQNQSSNINSTTLRIEIFSRFHCRYDLVWLCFANILTFGVAQALLRMNILDKIAWAFFIALLPANLVLEYLLCTQSKPPGTKETKSTKHATLTQGSLT